MVSNRPIKPTRMVWRVQLWSMRADLEVLSLLYFPRAEMLPGKTTVEAIWWAGSKASEESFSEMRNFVDRISREKINEAGVRYAFPPFSVSGGKIEFRKIEVLMSIAPTNSLWAPTSEAVGESPRDEAIRSSNRTRELCLRVNSVEKSPTVVDVRFHARVANPNGNELREFFDYLGFLFCIEVDPSALGYADEAGRLSEYLGVLEMLAPWPRAYSLLGERFDDLHPIMFGPPDICETLRRCLANKEVTLSNSVANHALLWIPQHVVANPDAKRRAEGLLVPRDETTAGRGHDPSLGEFEISGRVFYTARRYHELVKGKLIPQAHGYPYLHLVQPRYCQLVGIDPDEMIMDFYQKDAVNNLLSQIDARFSELPKSMSVKERVYFAHQSVLGRPNVNPREFNELWNFIRVKYFGAS